MCFLLKTFFSHICIAELDRSADASLVEAPPSASSHLHFFLEFDRFLSTRRKYAIKYYYIIPQKPPTVKKKISKKSLQNKPPRSKSALFHPKNCKKVYKLFFCNKSNFTPKMQLVNFIYGIMANNRSETGVFVEYFSIFFVIFSPSPAIVNLIYLQREIFPR